MLENNQISKFGIICPTYNRAHLIERAIDSLLAQSYQDWKLVIIDDGSTDQTDEVVKKYLDDTRISFVQLEDNKGVGFARNLAVENLQTEWILQLDSDNALFQEALYSIAAILDSSAEDALHMFSVVSFDGKAMGQKIDKVLKLSAKEYLCEGVNGEFYPVVRRNDIQKHSFLEDVNGGEGIIWKKIVLERGHIIFHPVITEYYDDTGEDRLSYRRKNMKRLAKIFWYDIAAFYKIYLLCCPLIFFKNAAKFIFYSVIALFQK